MVMSNDHHHIQISAVSIIENRDCLNYLNVITTMTGRVLVLGHRFVIREQHEHPVLYAMSGARCGPLVTSQF